MLVPVDDLVCRSILRIVRLLGIRLIRYPHSDVVPFGRQCKVVFAYRRLDGGEVEVVRLLDDGPIRSKPQMISINAWMHVQVMNTCLFFKHAHYDSHDGPQRW
jgi:hypothetical protein